MGYVKTKASTLQNARDSPSLVIALTKNSFDSEMRDIPAPFSTALAIFWSGSRDAKTNLLSKQESVFSHVELYTFNREECWKQKFFMSHSVTAK